MQIRPGGLSKKYWSRKPNLSIAEVESDTVLLSGVSLYGSNANPGELSMFGYKPKTNTGFTVRGQNGNRMAGY